ncbi:phosphate transporter 3,3 [Artemisia annua]|uniref:Phosphate transporter 3,3 n=1 Tax=Artemisia annua TaxID=35608 RepID=A0A2U1L2T8_ARTAN|nr:phosphate transporter 3,3 [Artemisia annua]
MVFSRTFFQVLQLNQSGDDENEEPGAGHVLQKLSLRKTLRNRWLTRGGHLDCGGVAYEVGNLKLYRDRLKLHDAIAYVFRVGVADRITEMGISPSKETFVYYALLFTGEDAAMLSAMCVCVADAVTSTLPVKCDEKDVKAMDELTWVNPVKFPSIASSLNILWKEEGQSSLWRGWSGKLFGCGVQGGFKFGLYEFFKRHYTDVPAGEKQSVVFFLSIASTQVFADIALCPFEAVKVHVQTGRNFWLLQRPPSALVT